MNQSSLELIAIINTFIGLHNTQLNENTIRFQEETEKKLDNIMKCLQELSDATIR